ncbi:YceD family protein [Jonesia quinghaiensis]|uniref:YceD family protein n=1 Tax=Jonesia quinghaiensis TaxID=262806 RepID=UPI0003FA82B6|nr:DUF177 domain-containing protein [Jonesia quinghaiensis]
MVSTVHISLNLEEYIISINPRSPFVLDVLELSRRPGVMREVHLDLEAPVSCGTPVMSIPEGDKLTVDVRLESVVEGVLVSGTVSGVARGECVRCLDEVVEDISTSIQELYFYPDRAQLAAEDGDESSEVVVLENNEIDLEPLLRDSVVFELPFQPLCSPDCPGLCSECGVHLADEVDHAHDNVDPRWSTLQTLLNETKES